MKKQHDVRNMSVHTDDWYGNKSQFQFSSRFCIISLLPCRTLCFEPRISQFLIGFFWLSGFEVVKQTTSPHTSLSACTPWPETRWHSICFDSNFTKYWPIFIFFTERLNSTFLEKRQLNISAPLHFKRVATLSCLCSEIAMTQTWVSEANSHARLSHLKQLPKIFAQRRHYYCQFIK